VEVTEEEPTSPPFEDESSFDEGEPFEVESNGKTNKKESKLLKQKKKPRGAATSSADHIFGGSLRSGSQSESAVFETDHGLNTIDEDGAEPEVESVRSEQFLNLESSGRTRSQCFRRNFGCSAIVSKDRGQDLGVDGVVYITFVMLLSRLFACWTMVSLPLALYYWSSGERQNLALSSFTASNLDPGSASMWVCVAVSLSTFASVPALISLKWGQLRDVSN
jgi:hypothetical protein